MARFTQSKWWKNGLRAFQWARILVWLLVVFILGSLIYLNEVGLPDFIKNPLIAGLRNRGLDLRFQKMRLHWYRGILAQQVNLGSVSDAQGPQWYADEVELRFDTRQLLRFKLVVEALRIHNARMAWRLQVPDRPAEILEMDNIRTDLRFLPDDRWELDRFKGNCLGTQFRLIGSLANASQWRAPQIQGAGASPSRVAWTRMTHAAVSCLRQLQYSSPPRLTLVIRGDAADFSRSTAQLGLEVAHAQSPWGDLSGLAFNANGIQPSGSNGLVRAEVSLSVDQVHTREGNLDQWRIDAVYDQSVSNALPSRAQFHAQAGQIRTAWASGHQVDLQGQWFDTGQMPHPLRTSIRLQATNVIIGTFHSQHLQAEIQGTNSRTRWNPQQARIQVTLDSAGLRQQSGGRLELTGLATALNSPAVEPWSLPNNFLTNLAGYHISWSMFGQQIQATNLTLQETRLAGQWHYPNLNVDELKARLFDGSIRGHLGFDWVSRRLKAQIESDFDLQKIGPLLRPKSQQWLRQYAWSQPPRVQAAAQLILPSWTNQTVRWAEDVLPTLCLDGHIKIGQGAYRAIPVTAAETHFQLSNLVWRLPDLRVVRPEGWLNLDYLGLEETQDYRFIVQSHVDPNALHPLMSEGGIKTLRDFKFSAPPEIQGTVWGRWRYPERIGFVAGINLSNIVYRGEAFDSVQASLAYTNKVLNASDIRITRQGESVQSPKVVYSGVDRAVILSNAVCHMDPLVVTRVIGPQTTKAILPYQFLGVPDIRVDGVIPVDDADHSNLDFKVSGGPFHYSRFRCQHIQGLVQWRGDYLTLTNMQAEFYQGQLDGHAAFDFTPNHGSLFHFLAVATNADLQALMRDISTKSNHLEGVLQGTLNITHANSSDWSSWNGLGQARLRDGLIWDIPLFGMFTPVLNSISPGLGNSRASEGTATFRITNSVIYSRDLEIRSPAMRLHYDGTVDFDCQINARVEAELLRDAWLFGRLVSLAFYPLTKLFEYKVTGTLSAPKKEPLYLIPRILFLPFQPINAIKGFIFNPNSRKNGSTDSSKLPSTEQPNPAQPPHPANSTGPKVIDP